MSETNGLEGDAEVISAGDNAMSANLYRRSYSPPRILSAERLEAAAAACSKPPPAAAFGKRIVGLNSCGTLGS